MSLQKNDISFCQLSYTISALPLFPLLELQGVSEGGIAWDNIETAQMKLGADGIAVINRKPVLYTGTLNLQPNSETRSALDKIVDASTPKLGTAGVSIEVILVEKNKTTGTITTYTGGVITQSQAGNDADLGNGQKDRVYKLSFSNRVRVAI